MKNTSNPFVKDSVDLKKQSDTILIKGATHGNLLEPYFSFLFEKTTDSIIYCQMVYENEIPSDFIFLEVNPAFEKLTGIYHLSGRKATDIFPNIKSKTPKFLEIGNEVALNGIPQQFDTQLHSMGI